MATDWQVSEVGDTCRAAAGPGRRRSVQIEWLSTGTAHLGFPALLSVPHLLSREIKMNRRHWCSTTWPNIFFFALLSCILATWHIFFQKFLSVFRHSSSPVLICSVFPLRFAILLGSTNEFETTDQKIKDGVTYKVCSDTGFVGEKSASAKVCAFGILSFSGFLPCFTNTCGSIFFIFFFWIFS